MAVRFSTIHRWAFLRDARLLPHFDNRRQTESRGCLQTMPRCEGGKVGFAELTNWVLL